MKTCETCVYWLPNRQSVEQADDGKYECLHAEVGIRTRIEFGCTLHLGAEATEMNVPNHTTNGDMTDPNPTKVGDTEVLIVTYWKDFPWLEYALRSMVKYFSWFSGVTVAIPRKDLAAFMPLENQFRAKLNLRTFLYDEVPGKGMLQHMVIMANADQIVPQGTKYVLHTDADGIFKMPTTPEHYFWQDKPYYLIRTWASLGVADPRHPVSKSVSDCGQWKGSTDTQLGWDTEWYTMCMNTCAMPIDFYAPYRQHVATVHKRPFEDHMLAGRNEFPQTSMDWTAMGAWAHKFMHDRFTWFNVENPPYPVDRKKAFWSHGGITPEIRAELEEMVK